MFAGFMGRFDGFNDLPRDRQRFVERKRAPRDAVRQRRPLDELEHQRMCASTFFESVNRSDVRMIERGEQLCFALESRKTIGIGGEGGRKDLEGDVAIEPRIARPIHLTHTARAEP